MRDTKVEGFLDANILAYAYDLDDPVKYAKAREIVLDVYAGKKRLAVSTQTLSEFFTTVTKKIKRSLPSSEARQIIQDMIDFEGFNKLMISPQTVLDAIETQDASNASYWDSLIAATMQEHGILRIITEDKDFKKIPGIVAKNPFTETV